MELLKTKFHIPEFSPKTLVPRKRISGLIGGQEAIVIVSAPAGFGKTTVLSEWAQSHMPHVAWVSLEKSEDSPAVFWSYVLTAIASVTDGCGQHGLQQIASSGTGAMETILIGLINDLSDLRRPVTLVLDDYHVIRDRGIHREMEFFLDHIPKHMRIIIAGRQEPKLSLSKFRISGRLVEIREQELRFQDGETETLMNAIHGLALASEDIRALKTKIEGWAAGLMLAMLSIRDQEDRQSFIRAFTGSHRLVLDYLMEEVLAGLEEDLRDFMLKISILERFCPSLCDAVTGSMDSEAMLQRMDRANLFLIPLDHQGLWFRFHHLFRDFLNKTLAGKGDETVKDCHHKAFAWLKQDGCMAEAYDHGIRAGNMMAAADLLAEHGPVLLGQSGGYLVRQWIERLPESLVLNHPEVCCYHVLLSVMAGDFDREDLLYRDVFNGNPTVEGYRSLIKSYRYFYQDAAFDQCIEEIPRLFAVMPEAQGFARELGGMFFGLSLRYSGRIQEAYEIMSQASVSGEMTALRAINFADVLLGMGKLEEALDFINRIIESNEACLGENQLPEAGFLYVQKGSILREGNQLDEALTACKKGIFMGRNNEYIEFVFLANLEYAQVLWAAGHNADAVKAINRSMAAAKASATWGVNMTGSFKVRMELDKGNIARAETLVREMGDFSGLDMPYHAFYEWFAYLRVCLARNRFDRVHEVTDHMINQDLGSQRKARLMESYVLKALAYAGEGRAAAALDTLDRAFELTRSEGYVRIFLDEGRPMINLLQEAVRQKRLPDYLEPHLSHASMDCPKEPQDRTVVINTFNETFNEREVDVLKLMKDGFSNKMIAETLYLSVHTVRWYASRIFAKLDVKRRGEAVVHAEKYGLI